MKKIIILLNTRYYKIVMSMFIATTVLHLIEQFTQSIQVYLLGWNNGDALGLLGTTIPDIFKSKISHFFYSLTVLMILIMFKLSFINQALFWWKISIWIQSWYMFECILLFMQESLGFSIFNSSTPTSLVQLFIPRLDFHLFYNILIFTPMLIALFYKKVINDEIVKRGSNF